MTKKLVILFSGSGTNLENIIQKIHNQEIENTTFEIVGLISNIKDAQGIHKASKYGLSTTIIDHKKYKSREDFDLALVNQIKQFDCDLVVLAGFMRILSPVFTDNIKAINLHPSLLPLFKGANAIKKSWDSDMRIAGISVHWVSGELDGGKIIDQRAFHKNEVSSFDEFESKIHQLEYELLPKVIGY